MIHLSKFTPWHAILLQFWWLYCICTIIPTSTSFGLREVSSRVINVKQNALSAASLTPPLLVTFDLDDTLFPVAKVIEDSNRILIQSLHAFGYTHTTVERFIESTKSIRTHFETHSNNTLRYTDIRKLAIQYEIMKHDCTSSDSSFPFNILPTSIQVLPQYEEMIDSIYTQWEMERHVSAERHLYPEAICMLQQIQTQFPSCVLGAITNGKGNPLHMVHTLKPYFDFCISGEDDTVFPYRKPHAKIFQAAYDYAQEIFIQRYYQQQGEDDDDEEKSLTFNHSLFWIHVGDDLCNDIAASIACGAKGAIWVDLQPQYGQTSNKRFILPQEEKQQEQQPSWSTLSKIEIEKRRLLSKDILQQVSADTVKRIDTLVNIPQVLVEWIQRL